MRNVRSRDLVLGRLCGAALLPLLLVGCVTQGESSDEPASAAVTGQTGRSEQAGQTATETTSPQEEVPGEEVPGEEVPGAVGSVAPAVAPIPVVVREVQPSVVAVLREQGEGSGVIYDDEGNIVTNNHVVAGARELTVRLATGERLPARVVATAPSFDLAVLRVTETADLPPAEFADELPVVGELAVAIGNPVGLESTVTSGIVSGLGRTVPAGQFNPALVDLIQTDAAISPGNSGGALADGGSQVIGVNVAYVPPQLGAVSIGFAIPAPTVTDVVEQLLATGEVRVGFLGITPTRLTAELAEQFGIETEVGVLVFDVLTDGPAAGELEQGDVITAVDGEEIETIGELFAVLRNLRPGERVTVTVLRDGREQEVRITLGERPREPPVGPQRQAPPTPRSFPDRER